MNLAISDFFLLAKMPIFIFNCFYFGPALGALGCESYGFIGGLTGTVSIMTLAAIALDRYYVIVYPLDPLRRTTRQRARVCVLLVWCYGGIFASLPLTGRGLSRYVPEGYLTSCSFDYLDQTFSNRIFILIFFIAAWVVPFSIITFCYTRIYREVISGSSGASSRRGQELEKRKTEVRLAGVVIGVVGLWFVAWTPYAVVALLGITGNAHLISPLSSMIPALFCKVASCIDPFVYAVTHPKFRREFQKFFFRGRARRKFEGMHGRTQCWKTESSQVPGMMIGIRQRRPDDSYSEDDIEEMVVMVDNRLQKGNCFMSSTIAPEEHSLCEITFPLDQRANQKLQHPSWFASPYPKRDRSTSLKLKTKSRNSNQSEPISV
ncbi:hypothetical protein J6590_028534 [Homalodisca vitripennis]|nr:hypothetical protein J6590_028534 [Homalodisca vitripennis]